VAVELTIDAGTETGEFFVVCDGASTQAHGEYLTIMPVSTVTAISPTVAAFSQLSTVSSIDVMVLRYIRINLFLNLYVFKSLF